MNKKLYLLQLFNCKQYLRAFSNKDIYRLIIATNAILPSVYPKNNIQLPHYTVMLAYRDALVEILDELYDNIN